ncbi:small ubiquitin-related modifier 2-A-like isoform X2 [Myzus persicae]|uniref:small ubiquitin-related modifier 2-A-like isoform X2 n=1 Tax=Myzus persicae TaxID=13164 RepID=UPI000B9367BB|nr:small ubiquitin-related modifier 2-A-like isoform X2 [Myzus persicae]
MSSHKIDEPAVSSVSIIIKVRKPDQTFIQFKINVATDLEKLMRSYCERCNIGRFAAVFIYRARRVIPSDTAASLRMQDGDCILVFHRKLIRLKRRMN